MFQMQIREYKGELQKPQNLDSPARIKSSHAGPLWIWMRNQHKMNMKY